MICNVLHKQNLADKIEFVPYPNIKRATVNLSAGLADMLGESLFLSETESGVINSDPIIEVGDFQVGVFTTPNRKDVLAINSAAELRKLRGITVAHWLIDLKTLKGMELSSVVTTIQNGLIPGMIENDRADFTLSYLDKTKTLHMGRPLIRVDGFRVSFDDPRVFAFSSKNKHLAEAINEFIRENRAAEIDRIREAYKASGFIVNKYSNWIDATKP